MKTIFKILGLLLVLAVGLVLMFYSNVNRDFSKAEKASTCGDFEAAQIFYEKGMKNLEKFPPILKISFLKNEHENIKLSRAWAFYNQGYFEAENYDLAEEIAKNELDNKNLGRKDQFYNLEALIFWQKGVELFIEMGKKAAYSEELNQYIEDAQANSGKAVETNDGKDFDIKYNYEFFRKPKEELKKLMQQAAQQKMQARQIKAKIKQMVKPQPSEENQDGDQKKTDEKKKGAKVPILVPQNNSNNPAREITPGSQIKKKKKKG